MNAVERFFRRYILSTVGILVLFFIVNLLLLGTFALILYLNGAADSSFPTEEFSGHIVLQNGELTADASAQELLQHAKAWAMILRDDGKVIWEEGLPEELPRQYSVTDVALFSRWYLNDYPIHIWKRTDGLLVIGFPPGSVIQFYSSTQSRYALPSLTGIAVIFVINILLMIYLFLRNVRRIERSIEPILEGIHSLSLGKAFRLEEKGDLAEINASLNRTGEYLIKKDNTRAEWIRGVSHDIRTPLSMILGYASEMEDTPSLPQTTRKQAGIIRTQGEKLTELVTDLNLTTKLEYSLQPIKKQPVNPVELARQVVSEFLNNGLGEACELEISEEHPGKAILLYADDALLRRMLSNLIRNSILHNAEGCRITVLIGSTDNCCTFTVSDTGTGLSESQLQSLNSGHAIPSTCKETNNADHGLGLKIIRQIVKVHQGEIHFSNNSPHGLCVEIKITRYA